MCLVLKHLQLIVSATIITTYSHWQTQQWIKEPGEASLTCFNIENLIKPGHFEFYIKTE